MSKGIVISPDKCTGCRTCELVCSFMKNDNFNPKDAAISVLAFDEVGLQVPMTCLQCDEPHCVAVCTVNALTKDEETGVVHYDGEKCIGCKMCVSACPFGNITYSARIKEIVKCDECGGDPQCVKLCVSGALEYKDLDSSLERRRNIANQFKEVFGEVAE